MAHAPSPGEGKEISMGMALFIASVAAFLVVTTYAIIRFPREDPDDTGSHSARKPGKPSVKDDSRHTT
jgi:hypothetical protein